MRRIQSFVTAALCLMARIATNCSVVPPLSPTEYSRERNRQICRSSSRRDTNLSSTPKQRRRWVLRFRLTLSLSPTRSLSDQNSLLALSTPLENRRRDKIDYDCLLSREKADIVVGRSNPEVICISQRARFR